MWKPTKCKPKSQEESLSGPPRNQLFSAFKFNSPNDFGTLVCGNCKAEYNLKTKVPTFSKMTESKTLELEKKAE